MAEFSLQVLVFVIWEPAKAFSVHTPAQHLDFDAKNISASVTKAFEEAITCHANECFVASALIVRKTLEKLCHEWDAHGADLQARLRNLAPRSYFSNNCSMASTICVCSKDAVHIESQEFNTIGKEEAEIGIHFTKAMPKVVFQYSDLLAKLRSRQATKPYCRKLDPRCEVIMPRASRHKSIMRSRRQPPFTTLLGAAMVSTVGSKRSGVYVW